MIYACLHQQEFEDLPYRMEPLRHEDIFLIKQWRNEQMDILRQNVLLTDAMQKSYFENVIKPSFTKSQPEQILFSFFKNALLIGYGGMVHIDWKAKEGEVSFLVDTEREKNSTDYRSDFSSFLKLIKSVAFKDLQFKRLFAITYDIRPLHLSILENSGFIEEKRLKNEMTINEKLVDVLIHGCEA
ncbi:MAG TPA: GNAT family N-acetyltransferase [Parachlamydiaceae bacterium]|nr:GNAT family N-acetyltransferase [Parachlamydiaceae bacterium]